MGELRMPSLGADMERGTLVEWRVAAGDEVHRGDIVAVVDTDKAEIEIEVFEDGVVDRLLVAPGTEVPVGTPIAALRPVGAPAVAPSREAPAPVLAPTPAEQPAAPVPPPPPPPVWSPLVRRLAAARGIDLAAVHGSGVGGAITRRDVESAAIRPPRRQRVSPRARRLAREHGIDLSTLPAGAGPLTGADVLATLDPGRPSGGRQATMRRAIADVMARANREIPHYHLRSEIDLHGALARLEEANAARPVADRVLPAALLLRAVARAARETPDLNGHWIDGDLCRADSVHLGVAIALRGGGLVAPCIHDADRLDPEALMAALRDLVARARAGRLRGSEMTDGTITVTNLGELGVDEVHPVIQPPQVAMVGFGRIRERPWAEGGMVGARPTVIASLAGDHRASDGIRGARLLTVIERTLQEDAT